MNCAEVTERLAAYLDGQLAPADAEHVGEHLYGCTPCHQLCDAMMGQNFAPMSQEEMDAGCGTEGFWDSMDTALETELASLAPSNQHSAGWRKARLGVPLTVALAYAAALLLAVVWGYQHMERARAAEATALQLQQQLEQERRLAAEPQAIPRVPAYRPVVYTPQRATF